MKSWFTDYTVKCVQETMDFIGAAVVSLYLPLMLLIWVFSLLV